MYAAESRFHCSEEANKSKYFIFFFLFFFLNNSALKITYNYLVIQILHLLINNQSKLK